MIRFYSSLICLFAVASVTMSGCTTAVRKQPMPTASATAHAELQTTLSDMDKKPTPHNIQRLKQFTKKYPNTDVTADANAALGEYYYKQKNYPEALKAFDAILQSEFHSTREPFAHYGSVKSLFQMRDWDRLIKLSATSLTRSDLTPTYYLEILRARCQALEAQSRLSELPDCLLELISKETEPGQKEFWTARLNECIDYKLPEEELRNLAKKTNRAELSAKIYYRLGIFAYERKDFSATEEYFEKSLYSGAPYQEQVQTILGQLKARSRVDTKMVGAVLPLSGRFANVGYKTLKGILLGLGLHGNNKSDFRLSVIDSESNYDKARRAMDELVLKDHVVGVIGSPVSRTSIAEALKSQEYGVPIIGLSQKADLTDVGEFVFRDAATSRMLVRQLVKMAMVDKGMKKFAILFPNDAYGIEYANLFWDEVLARGGQIAAAQPYKPADKDFSGPIQRLVNTYYLEDRQEELGVRLKDWVKKQKAANQKTTSPPTDLLPPIVDFEAIFIPDGVRTVGQIAPALAFYDVHNVTLLGTNLWNTKALIERGQKLVEGAMFVDVGINDTAALKKSAFYKEFLSTFGEEPTQFEAQGYEAALAFRYLLTKGYSNRRNLADGLRGLSNFDGVLGPLPISDSREFRPAIQGYSVKGGEIISF